MSHKIAQLLLDFPAEQSVCGGVYPWRNPMDAAVAEPAIKAYLKEIHTRLDHAASIAKAANACAEAGNADKGVQVALDIEELIHEATRLLDAATLINRLAKQE
jgi:hypothetical protein